MAVSDLSPKELLVILSGSIDDAHGELDYAFGVVGDTDPPKAHEAEVGERVAWLTHEHIERLLGERDVLAAMIRDLAARQPSDYEGYACGMCRTPDAMSHPEDHRSDCTWRRSVEWVKAHPEP